MNDSAHASPADVAAAQQVARRFYGRPAAAVDRVASFNNRVLRLRFDSGPDKILKIARPGDPAPALVREPQVIAVLRQNGLPVPRVEHEDLTGRAATSFRPEKSALLMNEMLWTAASSLPTLRNKRRRLGVDKPLKSPAVRSPALLITNSGRPTRRPVKSSCSTRGTGKPFCRNTAMTCGSRTRAGAGSLWRASFKILSPNSPPKRRRRTRLLKLATRSTAAAGRP